MNRHTAATSARPSRAFSLVEVLLAVFILGIGVISIAALFPAGIAQQRLTNDDVMGPIVANHAIALLRTKLTPDDFGTFEFDFGINTPDVGYSDADADKRATLVGDWPWLRPGTIYSRDPTYDVIYPDPPVPPGTDCDTRGAIDIFSSYAFWQTLTNGSFDSPVRNGAEFAPTGHPLSPPTRRLFGIPFNTLKYTPATSFSTSGTGPPRILILQNERFYPMAPRMYVPPGDAPRPQYMWDCMFRRFEGRILVAIFVYRVNMPGASPQDFYVNPDPNSPRPSMPWRLDLLSSTPTGPGAGDPWDVGGIDKDYNTIGDNNFIVGTPSGTAYNPGDSSQAWQEPRQWIVDINNNIHRVLSAQRVPSNGGLPGEDPAQTTSGSVWVEFARPLAPVMGGVANTGPPRPTLVPYYYRDDPANPPFPNMAEENIATNIWYVPLQMAVDLDGNGSPDVAASLTPVYATVQEL